MVLEQFVEAINRNLTDGLARNIYDRAEKEYPTVAKFETTSRYVDEFQAIQGLALPQRNRDQENPPQVSPVKGYKTTIRQVNYRSQLTVEDTLMRSADYPSVYDNMEDMVTSNASLKDQVAVDFFNNGFTDGLSTNIVEYDGTARAPFSTGHYYENGSGTFSNYLNTGVPPTPEVVYQMINQYIRRLKDYAGNFISWPKEFTIVTPTLNTGFGLAADEIVQSVDRPDTANRATNVLKNFRLNHVSLNYLTSSTKWFILVPTGHRAYPLRMRVMIDNEVTPLEKKGPTNPHVYLSTLRTIFGVGWKYSYRGITAIGS